MNANGQAFALWIQGSGSSYNAYGSFTLTPYTNIESMTWETPFALNSTTNIAVSSIPPTITNPENRGGSQDNGVFGAWVEEPSPGNYTIYCAVIGLGPTAISVDSSLTIAPTIQAAQNFIDIFGIVAAGPTSFNVYTSLNPTGMPPMFTTQTFTGMSIAGTPVLSYDQNSNGILVWNDLTSIYAATYDFPMATWSSAESIATASKNPWVSAFGYSSPQQGIAIWVNTNSIKSATLNYSPPPSGFRKRPFQRPSNRRAAGSLPPG